MAVLAQRRLLEWSAVVDGTYQVNDRFSISGGLRYSDETKDAIRTFILDPTNPISSGEQSASFDEVSGRLHLVDIHEVSEVVDSMVVHSL